MSERDPLEALRIDRDAKQPVSPWASRAPWIALAILLLAALGWWLSGGESVVRVRTTVVRSSAGQGAAASVLDASGYVVARRRATVASKVTGRLVEVGIEEGMKVEEGQILARLDDANARRSLALAEAELAAAEGAVAEIDVRRRQADVDLRRVQDLAAQGISSASALDAARAERDSLVARLAATRDAITVAEREVASRAQDVEDTLIRAPFGGVAISKDAQPGEIVSPVSAGGGFTRTGIGTIVDMGSLEIEVDVNEAFIQRVEPGQPVVATLGAYPDWKIPAKVITTVPTADRQKATVKVRIGFEEVGDPRLLPDMGVKVAFQAPAKTESSAAKLVIAARAVRRDGATAVVFVLDDETVERRAIALGGSVGNEVEVLSGLRAGETLVLDPPDDLVDGSRVARASDR